jgi:DNA invertase Pin-like site-specific DNA recombinase
MGRFLISVMSAFSELEREMIVERVVAGVKKAQANGRHCRRPRRVFRRDRLLELKAAGKSLQAISRELGVVVGTLFNALPKGSPKNRGRFRLNQQHAGAPACP